MFLELYKSSLASAEGPIVLMFELHEGDVLEHPS